MNLFVYWRVAPERATQAEAAVRVFQETWRQRHPGLQARLYRRSETARLTLMETYLDVPAELEQPLLQAAEAALAGWAIDGRHVERFERLAP